ncbi:2-succinyl-6-hydroxy-2,4-cyclohexadiene-1-carboxylate synthase [candidate division KSB1 bacterium]
MCPVLNHIVSGSPDGHPLLFIHGFLGDSRDWDEVIALLENKYYVITIDLPGHGKSAGLNCEKEHAFSKTAHNIIDILNYLDIRKCSVIGYSMGGRIALYTSLTEPDRFNSLFLESASFGIISEIEREKRYRDDILLADEIENSEISEFVEKWYSQPIFRSLSQHPKFESVKEKRAANDRKRIAEALRMLSVGNQPSLWEEIKKLKIPVIYFAGELDKKYCKTAEELTGISFIVNKIIVKDCGHNVHLEKPEVYCKELERYINYSGGKI